MKRLVLMLFLLWWSNIACANISIKVNPSSIQLNDTFKVEITSDKAISNDSPNLTPLLKDFTLLSTERSISYSNINGNVSSTSKWSLILRANKTGTITIPSISLGNEKSPPTQVIVTNDIPPATDSDSKESKSSYTKLQANVDDPTPFLNQQIIYTVKLLNKQKLFDAQYKNPEVENALVIPLGDGKIYQTQENGELFEVEEQKYAIFPQKKGKIVILPPEFTANLYDGFSPTQLHISAKPVVLNVKSLPDGVGVNSWLAAKNVDLEESFDNLSPNLREGDTIVRTIKLNANGAVAQLLPTVHFSSTANYNVYVDKPIIQNELVNGELLAIATYKVTYLLAKAENINLPAINVPWYNIISKKNEVASLPAKDITVNPKTTTHIKKIDHKKQIINSKHTVKKSMTEYIKIFCLMMFVVAIVLYILKLILSKRAIEDENNISIASSLQKACKKNDPIAARLALIDFARKNWPELQILNLNDIPINNAEFKAELKLLSLALYSKNNDLSWSGDELWRIFSKLKFEKNKRKKSKADLPPIYL